jgi:hypothetical protein
MLQAINLLSLWDGILGTVGGLCCSLTAYKLSKIVPLQGGVTKSEKKLCASATKAYSLCLCAYLAHISVETVPLNIQFLFKSVN